MHGSARFNRPDRIAVRTPDDTAAFFEFEQAIIATGSRGAEPPGLRFDDDRVLDCTAALALTAVPASAAVVGAGYIGLGLATALAKLGAKVTLVEARSQSCPRSTPPWLRRCCVGSAGWALTCASAPPLSASTATC